jgi:hypothetical protein
MKVLSKKKNVYKYNSKKSKCKSRARKRYSKIKKNMRGGSSSKLGAPPPPPKSTKYTMPDSGGPGKLGLVNEVVESFPRVQTKRTVAQFTPNKMTASIWPPPKPNTNITKTPVQTNVNIQNITGSLKTSIPGYAPKLQDVKPLSPVQMPKPAAIQESPTLMRGNRFQMPTSTISQVPTAEASKFKNLILASQQTVNPKPVVNLPVANSVEPKISTAQSVIIPETATMSAEPAKIGTVKELNSSGESAEKINFAQQVVNSQRSISANSVSSGSKDLQGSQSETIPSGLPPSNVSKLVSNALPQKTNANANAKRIKNNHAKKFSNTLTAIKEKRNKNNHKKSFLNTLKAITEKGNQGIGGIEANTVKTPIVETSVSAEPRLNLTTAQNVNVASLEKSSVLSVTNATSTASIQPVAPTKNVTTVTPVSNTQEIASFNPSKEASAEQLNSPTKRGSYLEVRADNELNLPVENPSLSNVTPPKTLANNAAAAAAAAEKEANEARAENAKSGYMTLAPTGIGERGLQRRGSISSVGSTESTVSTVSTDSTGSSDSRGSRGSTGSLDLGYLNILSNNLPPKEQNLAPGPASQTKETQQEPSSESAQQKQEPLQEPSQPKQESSQEPSSESAQPKQEPSQEPSQPKQEPSTETATTTLPKQNTTLTEQTSELALPKQEPEPSNTTTTTLPKQESSSVQSPSSTQEQAPVTAAEPVQSSNPTPAPSTVAEPSTISTPPKTLTKNNIVRRLIENEKFMFGSRLINSDSNNKIQNIKTSIADVEQNIEDIKSKINKTPSDTQYLAKSGEILVNLNKKLGLEEKNKEKRQIELENKIKGILVNKYNVNINLEDLPGAIRVLRQIKQNYQESQTYTQKNNGSGTKNVSGTKGKNVRVIGQGPTRKLVEVRKNQTLTRNEKSKNVKLTRLNTGNTIKTEQQMRNEMLQNYNAKQEKYKMRQKEFAEIGKKNKEKGPQINWVKENKSKKPESSKKSKSKSNPTNTIYTTPAEVYKKLVEVEKLTVNGKKREAINSNYDLGAQ